MDRIAEIAAMARHWSALADLAPKETTRFLSTIGPIPLCPAGTELTYKSDESKTLRIVLSGWAMSYFVLAEGRRQIIDFHLPGELLESASFANSKTCLRHVALSDLQLANFEAFLTDTSADLSGARFARAHFRDQELDRHIMRIASLGCRGGKAKVAILFMDWYHRLEKVGLAAGGVFRAPVTQDILGEALGLSAVHINRIVQQLRHDGIIRMTKCEIEILDLQRLASVAGWN